MSDQAHCEYQHPAASEGVAPISERDFWYVAAESRQLRSSRPIAREILGEWLVFFRDQDGRPVALQDRCLHRSGRLSEGKVQSGRISCPYHGWTYDSEGAVVAIPSEGSGPPRIGRKCAVRYETREQDGYVYVRFDNTLPESALPFNISHYGEKGWRTLRLIHRFQNSVTNCVENFVDIPHTVSVHAGIFRSARNQRLSATITRAAGSVVVQYENEDTNLGLFSRFLNPSGRAIVHTDAFYMPNVTRVEYDLGPHRNFIITSQSVPVTARETLVYTDLTYDYGVWNRLAVPLVWLQAKVIIAQDLKILKSQSQVLDRYGARFSNSPADIIHTMIESIRTSIANGSDPRLLRDETKKIEFWI